MKLSVRLAAAFVAFVVAGSLALVMWLGFEERRQSHEHFAAMARTNAEFIRSQKLPTTERTADALSEVLAIDVLFVTTDHGPNIETIVIEPVWNELTKPLHNIASYNVLHAGPGVVDFERLHYADLRAMISKLAPNRKLRTTGDYWESVTWPISENSHLMLLRPQKLTLIGHLPRPLRDLPIALSARSFFVLATFWFLSFALAFALARGIVRPLRALATRLPRISEEKDEPIPETARTDEIGQLARAYAGTRSQLAAEREARQQAERLAALGKMATGLAHEINNPVAAIKLHAQLLEEAGKDAGDVREEVGTRLPIILAESAKIESLVSQWMFLARPQPPQTSPCDFSEILAATIRALTPAAQHAAVQIINEVPPGCIVAADRRRLSQAITNVITNAIHAMSARGGVLTVEGPATFDPRPSTFDIAFRDSGPGFSAAALASATDLFFSEKEGGMGIGLNVAAGILNAHGGELRIANAPGGGAVVTFVLPAVS